MNNPNKVNVLILCDYFAPGYKAGGALKAVVSIVEHLGDHINFKIITRDRDIDSNKSYDNISANAWNKYNNSSVYYLSPEKQTVLNIRKIINESNCDIIYLNSFFSSRFTIIPLFLIKFRLINIKNIILSPRGELFSGALALKKIKKKLYIKIFQIAQLYRNIKWIATTKTEQFEIQHFFGINLDIQIINDLIQLKPHLDKKIYFNKTPGSLKIIFLSRIAKNKNLLGAINILKNINGNIIFDIYGPISDKSYWLECKNSISELPENIKATYCGIIHPNEVDDILKKYHVFFLPTMGENFCYAIIEALYSGIPVLISDKTPWRNLETLDIGWDLSLDEPNKFIKALQSLVEMDENTLRTKSINAINFVTQNISISKNKLLMIKLFGDTIKSGA